MIHVPDHSQCTHSYSITIETNQWAGGMSAHMQEQDEQKTPMGPNPKQLHSHIVWIRKMNNQCFTVWDIEIRGISKIGKKNKL